MARIWSDEGKLAAWLEVELAATAAWADFGVVPSDAAARIAQATPPTAERVAELEATLQHDTAAFVDAVAEQLGDEGRWVHYGLTSSDVGDTALSLQVREAGTLILAGLDRAFAAGGAPQRVEGLTLRVAQGRDFAQDGTLRSHDLARLDEDGIPGEVRIVRALSDTHPAATQGPVWYVGGKPV